VELNKTNYKFLCLHQITIEKTQVVLYMRENSTRLSMSSAVVIGKDREFYIEIVSLFDTHV